MGILTAHAHFGRRGDRDVLAMDFTVDGNDFWPACATAMAMLSRMLDDTETDVDLDEAGRHGASLVDAGVVSIEELGEERRMWCGKCCGGTRRRRW